MELKKKSGCAQDIRNFSQALFEYGVKSNRVSVVLRPSNKAVIDRTNASVWASYITALLFLVFGLFLAAPAAEAVEDDRIPTQWIARHYTELLGRAPTPEEWTFWLSYYQMEPACTAGNLATIGKYLVGLQSSPNPVSLPPANTTEFATLYPASSHLDKAMRLTAVVRAVMSHDPNDNDWASRFVPYLQGSKTFSATVDGIYSLIFALVGTDAICSSDGPNSGFGYARPLDLRAKIMEAFPGLNPPLAPSRTQAQLTSALNLAASGATVAERTVSLLPGEVVRIGGPPSGNQGISVPAGVTLTSEGFIPYVEPVGGASHPGLAYARMGRLVPYTTAGGPWWPITDGLVCVYYFCNSVGILTLNTGAHLDHVWLEGSGLGRTNYKLALVQTMGSAPENLATIWDDRTSVVANRMSVPNRDGVGIRALGSSVGSPCAKQKVAGNLITGYTSLHEFDESGQAAWASGIEVHCEDSNVVANDVVDVSDAGIRVHGNLIRATLTTVPQISQVRYNRILSAGIDAHIALGIDTVGKCMSVNGGWLIPCIDEATPRDVSGTILSENVFFTGPRTSFDVGLSVGGGVLWGPHQILNNGLGASVTGNTTGVALARVNIGIAIHDMLGATVTGNTANFELVDGSPRHNWGKCPQVEVSIGSDEMAFVTTDISLPPANEDARGCLFGAPPESGIEGIAITADGMGFKGDSTGYSYTPYGMGVHLEEGVNAAVAQMRSMRHMGANIARLLLELEDFVDAPTCPTCAPTPNPVALARLGDIATAAEQQGLYLDITGLGIATTHHIPSWFDDLGASAADEEARWFAQEIFWSSVASELAGHNSVAWYDLMNEPLARGPEAEWCAQDIPPETSCWVQNLVKDLRGRTAESISTAWITRMRDAIKVQGGDTNHLVSIGIAGFTNCGGPFKKEVIDATLDFSLFHRYPTEDSLADDISIVKACKIDGKPLVVEETFNLKAGIDIVEQFILGTQPEAAGWMGHYIGGTPSQLTDELSVLVPGSYDWWVRVFWLEWDRLFMRNAMRLNPSGTGVMK